VNDDIREGIGCVLMAVALFIAAFNIPWGRL
jgi:hypothetical protein